MPHLLMLEVEMPGLTGIQLAKTFSKFSFISFALAHAHYALDAVEVEAVDNLVKPVSIEKMMRAIEKVMVPAKMKRTVT